MAHFAELDENNIVLRVVVIEDAVEADGENWCQNFYGGGNWKQTSYNTNGGRHFNNNKSFRKNYAGIGYTYDSTRDAFIPPQPYPSWLLDEDKCTWESPVPHPTVPEGSLDIYTWNEDTQAWDLVI